MSYNYASADSAEKVLKRLEDLREKYNELLYAVGNKYPDETRHQTALRYIIQAEAPNKDACCVNEPKRASLPRVKIRRRGNNG